MAQISAAADIEPDELLFENALSRKAKKQTIRNESEVSQKNTDIIRARPAALNTSSELATPLNSEASYATTIANTPAAKAPLDDPTFTDTISGITNAMIRW